MPNKFSAPSGLVSRVLLIGFSGILLAGLVVDVITGALRWPNLLAPVCYTTGLWFASGIIVRLEHGGTFSDTVITGLTKVGASLMLAGILAILVAPALVHLQANGFAEMRGMTFDLELANLMLAVTGLVLILIARRGAQLRAQLESFV